MGRIRGDAGSGEDGICGNGDDNGVSGDGGGIGIAKNLSASSLVKDSRDNQLDPHHHPPPDPHPDQTQECILVTQQWVRQQQAVAAPQLERHHPLVVYTL
nr:hypothetical protein [Tanacetum cinerariifolium]